MNNKVLSSIICICLCMCFFIPALMCTVVASTVITGSCGENLTWKLDDSGTLTISGKGEMEDYHTNKAPHAPWFSDNIKRVVIGDEVTHIGEYAFYYCENIVEVSVGGSVASIGRAAFSNCKSLTKINIPKGVTTIGTYAFFECEKLNDIDIPDSVINIGSNAFSSTGYYEDESNWENGILYMGNYLIRAKLNIESADVKEGTKCIADFAFSHIRSLRNIKLPESLEYIGNSAFYQCNLLTDFVLPSNVKVIGEFAFSGCIFLKSITIPRNVVRIGEYAFYDCIKSLVIYGYEGSCAEIYASENGINFVVIEDDDIYEKGDINGDGKVNSRDVGALRRNIAGGYDDVLAIDAMLDMNEDGKVNSRDVAELRKLIAGQK